VPDGVIGVGGWGVKLVVPSFGPGAKDVPALLPLREGSRA
jgi:hypothetical protein